MAKVEIYYKSWCGYSQRALRLLEQKGVAAEKHDIEAEPEARTQMLDRANGRTTVPQIFIDGQHIGGSDELAALERDGKLDALLSA